MSLQIFIKTTESTSAQETITNYLEGFLMILIIHQARAVKIHFVKIKRQVIKSNHAAWISSSSLIVWPNFTGNYYFPCGAIANSFFSDQFHQFQRISNPVSKHIDLCGKSSDIVWSDEKKYKFKNPAGIRYDNYIRSWVVKKFEKPRDWSQETYHEWWKGGGLENPHFINWMHPGTICSSSKNFVENLKKLIF